MEIMENNTQMVNNQNYTTLSAMSYIVAKSNGSQLSEEFFKDVEAPVSFICNKYNLTPVQSVLFSMIVEGDNGDSLSFNTIVEMLGCGRIAMLEQMPNLEELKSRKLIVESHNFRRQNAIYSVPANVIASLVNDKPIIPGQTAEMSFGALFNAISKQLERRSDREHDGYDEVMNAINSILDSSPNLNFVRKFNALPYDAEDKAILLILCNAAVNHAANNVSASQVFEFFPSEFKFSQKKLSIIDNKDALLTDKVIAVRRVATMMRPEWIFTLTTKTISELIPELNIKEMGESSGKKRNTGDIVKCCDIKTKAMSYNAKEQEQVEELRGLLENENYSDIKERMKEKSMVGGFSCLFYGAPGTGKTETALQLAKQTGRDIMRVDISSIRDSFIGESEKNVKAIFDNYRALAKKSKLTPILLFNEADALIGKRINHEKHSTDKMENAMQNIILQEMEVFEGILIATTNLEHNMDDAFERRFLYKIQFNKPDAAARKSIWLTKMPFLQEPDAEELAAKYEFSGGEIDNIAKKYVINYVLHGEDANSVDLICQTCECEKLVKKAPQPIVEPAVKQRKRIGY